MTEFFTVDNHISAIEDNHVFDVFVFDDYFETPLVFQTIPRLLLTNPYHKSAITLKQNILTSTFKETKYFSKTEFSKLSQDFLVFGNAYVEIIKNKYGHIINLKQVPALKCRRMKKTNTEDEPDDRYLFLKNYSEKHTFRKSSVLHLYEPTLEQEIYGLPTYLGGMNSMLLNESATLFRQKYYRNGSHAGFILYISDPTHEETDIQAIKEKLEQSKGPGNFRNMVVYAPNGKKDGLQIIPISEVTAKDEFFNIKNITMDDVLAAHRVPPQLMGIIPKNAGGFGNIEKASIVFNRNEIIPLQEKLKEINSCLGLNVIDFKKYEIDFSNIKSGKNNA